MMALQLKVLMFAWIHTALLVTPVHLADSKECSWWCAESDGKLCSEVSNCRVVYYEDEDFPGINKSKCLEIQDFSSQNVYGNLTVSELLLNDTCRSEVNTSELGIAFTWSVPGGRLTDVDYFTIVIAKIRITPRCIREDAIRIYPSSLTESMLDHNIHFRFLYTGTTDYFCMEYSVGYKLEISSASGCDPARTSTTFTTSYCPENVPTTRIPTVAYIGVCVCVAATFFIICGIVCMVRRKKRRRRKKYENRRSETKALLLLNPQVSEGELMERINTIATKISRVPGVNIDCNFWNRGQPQYNWVNNSLQKVNIVLIICVDKECSEVSTTDNFNNWIGQLLTASSLQEIVIVHPSDDTLHRCPFNSRKYQTVKMCGNVEKDTLILQRRILQSASSPSCDTNSLLPVNDEHTCPVVSHTTV